MSNLWVAFVTRMLSQNPAWSLAAQGHRKELPSLNI
jgi:hypothetical protein